MLGSVFGCTAGPWGRAEGASDRTVTTERKGLSLTMARAGRDALEFGRGFFDVPSRLLDVQARACISRSERLLGAVAGSRSRDGASQQESEIFVISG